MPVESLTEGQVASSFVHEAVEWRPQVGAFCECSHGGEFFQFPEDGWQVESWVFFWADAAGKVLGCTDNFGVA